MPTGEELLELYSLYKQGMDGDAQGARPGAWDFKARAKFDAWYSRKGTPREAAMKAYVAAVERLTARCG
jgi:acyl-CoA-binding protein